MIRLCSASELAYVPRERLAFCGGLYLLADFLFVAFAWSFETESYASIIALLLAQCTLVTLLAMTSKLPEIIRYALPIAATVGCLFVLTKLMPFGVRSDALPRMTLLMAGHTFATMLNSTLYRQIQEHQTLRLKFRVSTLMTWTTLVAIMFALGRGVSESWHWTFQTFTSSEALTSLLIGVLYGMSSIAWMHVFWTSESRRRVRRIAVSSVATIGGTYAFACGVNWFRNGDNYFQPLQLVILMIVFASVLGGSMTVMLIRKEAPMTTVAGSSQLASNRYRP